MNQPKYSSFTYHSVLGNSLMVVVPHEDDEVNLAGATIAGARQEGIPVYCVFVTNGDWEYPASVRLKEAAASLSTLGVPKENIIILGYPDGGPQMQNNVFMQGQQIPVMANGRNETYGADGIQDFAFLHDGKHHTYTWEHLIRDIKEAILAYRPDSLIAVDFDKHPDHRMCSMAFDRALGEILNRKNNDYFPLVYKGFAYSTSYKGLEDFYSPNLLPAKINPKALCHPEWETDNPAFGWKDRVRWIVPKDCGIPFLHKNRIFSALEAHISQKAHKVGIRVINSDQVFWFRRTENLMMKGEVSVSSGNSSCLNDGLTLWTDDIGPLKPQWNHYLWIPQKEDKEKSWKLILRKPAAIHEIDLWGNIDSEKNRILDGLLTLGNGFSIHTGPLAEHGQGNRFYLPDEKPVSWVSFRILEAQGEAPGLSEAAVFEKADSRISLLNIEINGTICHVWHRLSGERIHIGAYTYGISGKLQWAIDGKSCSLSEAEEIIRKDKKGHLLRVEADNPEVWSTCFISKENDSFAKSYHRKALWDHAIYKLIHEHQKWLRSKLDKLKVQH